MSNISIKSLTVYVQAVCVLFVLSVWRNCRRCCLTFVLRLLPRARKVFVVKFFGSGLLATFMSLLCAAAAEGLKSAALLGSTTLAGVDSRTSRPRPTMHPSFGKDTDANLFVEERS